MAEAVFSLLIFLSSAGSKIFSSVMIGLRFQPILYSSGRGPVAVSDGVLNSSSYADKESCYMLRAELYWRVTSLSQLNADGAKEIPNALTRR